MWGNKKKELKASYYWSFIVLIVVPILLIIILSIGIIRAMMRESAIDNIRRAQDNLVSTLNGEVKDISLRLSHFVYVNDNEIMKTAVKTDTRDIAERHHYTQELTEAFNYAMVPVQDILSAVFYMKDGVNTYMKDNVVLTEAEIKNSHWYQEALSDKNIVKMGFYNSRITLAERASNSFTLVAALAPGIDVDRDRKVEVVALFSSSQVGKLIRDYDKEERLGSTMILDGDGKVLFDRNQTAELLSEKLVLGGDPVQSYRMGVKEYVYVISEEPMSGCQIVSVVESGTLTREFNQIAVMIVGVTLVLFALFYLFSNYFLKNIIEPIHNTVNGMGEVESGNLEVRVVPEGQAELRTMIHSFNHMTRHLKQLIEENKNEQQKKHEAEIRALQSQINPHFLVNSLSSIRFIAQLSKFDSIAKMAEALIKILSCSFRSNTGFYTLKEELEVLDSFIYLMQIRYSNGFEIEYQVEEGYQDCLVPRLILQPIVENSIVHAFNEMVDEMGRIQIAVNGKDGFLNIRIQDNGKGMTQEEISNLLNSSGKEDQDNISIGITNVNSRLVLNYGKDCELGIESEVGAYTKTVVRLPIRRKEEGV